MNVQGNSSKSFELKKETTMSHGHLQGEQMTEARRVVLPWGRMLNNELSPLIARYGELVGNLLGKYGTDNVVVNGRVDEFKDIVEQLGALDDGHIIIHKVAHKGSVSTTELKKQTATTLTPDELRDNRLAGRIRSKAVSLLRRAYEAWMTSESARRYNLSNEGPGKKLEARKLSSMTQMRLAFYDWVRKLLPIGQSPGISSRGEQILKSVPAETANSDAEFLGWQRTKSGDAIALYNVTAEQHPLYQSTVSEKTLIRENLEVPQTPHRDR
jgi:hypothetical protein